MGQSFGRKGRIFHSLKSSATGSHISPVISKVRENIEINTTDMPMKCLSGVDTPLISSKQDFLNVVEFDQPECLDENGSRICGYGNTVV